MITLQVKIASYLAFVLLLFGTQCSISNAQFLFTYEINQESDDSRAPKSSLFDPSSFRIVTPSQLQNTYQKLSSQPIDSPPPPASASSSPPISGPANADSLSPVPLINDQSSSSINTPSLEATHQEAPQPTTHQQTPSSLLKQTSVALQSFAELFSLSSPTSSPSPLSALQGPAQQVSAPAVGNNAAPVDQQAEARSLHEHWTQQQQSSHQHLAPLNTNHEFNQLQTHPSGQNNQQSIATAALNSFTTNQPVGINQLGHQQAAEHQSQNQITSHNHNHQPQPSQASYWLTANPLNGPEGNYLVQIKQQQQQQQQQQQVSSPATLIDNLLTVGSPRSALMDQSPTNRVTPPKSSTPTATSANSAQASFLSTPTSYYPPPAESSTRASRPLSSSAHQHVPSEPFGLPATASQPHQHFPRATTNFVHTTAPTAPQFRPHQLQDSPSLQPPANIPENFIPTQTNHQHHQHQHQHHQQQHQYQHQPQHHHKSAEESLISFRQQQNQQHDQQSALFSAQQQLFNSNNQQHKPRSGNHSQPTRINQQQQYNSAQPFQNNHHQQQQPRQLPQQQQQQLTLSQPVNQPPNSQQNHAHHQLGEIPKVSPQIYESFLLQQRDQHEKHMELLKQQQELNKLLEQKHKQQEAELKRKRKKEELENVNSKEAARKKAIREQEIAKKLKLEQEERDREAMRKKQRDEEERKRQVASAEEQQRRYREYLETKEREKREREAAVALKRQRLLEEEEARELKIRLEREQREQVVAERRRQAELLAEKQRREKEAEDAKYVNYLHQQEELRKLLELKQKDDEAIQNRRKQAIALQQQRNSVVSAGRNRLATASSSDNRRDQSEQQQSSNSPRSSWGTPIRSRQAASLQANINLNQESSPIPTTPPPTTTSTTATSTSSAKLSETTTTTRNRQQSEAEAIISSGQKQRPRGYLVKKQKTYDEKLIRQKIPLYSGPGQYGLYRGGNESIANDVAALLESVVLPPSSTTSTTTTTTPAPTFDTSRQVDDTQPAAVTPSSSDSLPGSSLSPLLNRANLNTEKFSTMQPVDSGTSSSNEPFFDDDVPRRPARGLTAPASQNSVLTNIQNSESNRQKTLVASGSSNQRLTSRFNESSSTHSQSSSKTANIGLATLPPDTDNDGIAGVAGRDYPNLRVIPPTSFSCAKQPLNGYYADTETACQVVHLCQGGVQSSILCPNGTIFNQEKFSCQWWYEVDCSRAPIFYQLNDNLYKSLPGSSSSSTTTEIKKRSKKVEKQSTNSLAASAS